MSILGRWVVHSMIFVSAFAIDVRVKAAQTPSGLLDMSSAPAVQLLKSSTAVVSAAQLKLAETPLQEPADCLNQTGVCTFRTGASERYVLRTHGATVHVDRETAVVRNPNNTLVLVSGSVWVQTGATFTVKTQFGEATIEKGEAWIHLISSAASPTGGSTDRTMVAATAGDVTMRPNGAKSSLVVEPGFENFMRGVESTGVGETGIPTAINYRDHLAGLARLYPGSRENFENDVKAFHIVWQAASERSAEIHRELYSRKISSVDEQRLEVQKKRKSSDDDRRHYRELMLKHLADQ